ncbi:MAG: signal peptidase I [Candidatus Pacebacteria bacterium]|nr:signal peptidase I [Candidatus Paceibacterota bacterium]
MELKEFVIFLLDSLKILLIALAIVIPVRMLLFQPFVVKGDSMEPNYHSGDYLIIDELSYKLRDPQRGEVIVFKYPKDPSYRYIKRIIALPNETIELKNGEIYVSRAGSEEKKIDESLYINDKTREAWKRMLDYGPLTLGGNEYFVMGDNRNYSSDSRTWGVLPADKITGKILLRVSLFEVLLNTMNSVNSTN